MTDFKCNKTNFFRKHHFIELIIPIISTDFGVPKMVKKKQLTVLTWPLSKPVASQVTARPFGSALRAL